MIYLMNEATRKVMTKERWLQKEKFWQLQGKICPFDFNKLVEVVMSEQGQWIGV